MKYIIMVLLTVKMITAQEVVFEDFTVIQCDSLIEANSSNPNFVILDVRTPNEYLPKHLEGAIMRDYYNSDFSNQLDDLIKEKTYLIHCRSGARSANSFQIMKDLGFVSVFNMLGGMNSWSSNGLPTTSLFEAKISLVDISPTHINLVQYQYDTIDITITNRANDTLVVEELEGLPIDEFHSNFVSGTNLLGAEDYTFQVYFSPILLRIDTIDFRVISNVGNIDLSLYLDYSTGTHIEEDLLNVKIFPNPCKEKLYFDFLTIEKRTIDVFTGSGDIVKHIVCAELGYELDVSGFPKGLLYIRIIESEDIHHFEIVNQ